MTNSSTNVMVFTKQTKELVDFTKEFETLNGFELDYIYTNKMMFGISE
jgi:1-aminocyclopropane-1-carboxylate deaminase/D-cysteine desulfhydrase-like pyridoxal-dependent ACC family enzyme